LTHPRVHWAKDRIGSEAFKMFTLGQNIAALKILTGSYVQNMKI